MANEKLRAERQTYLLYLVLKTLSHGQAAALLAGLNPEYLSEIMLCQKLEYQPRIEGVRTIRVQTKIAISGASQSELLAAKKKIEKLKRYVEVQFPARSVPNSRLRTGKSRDEVVVPPAALIRWATEIELELPEELRSASAKLFGERDPSLNHSDALSAELEVLKAENARLTEQVARLENECGQLRNENLKPKERNSLLRMVYWMARKGYGWDPKSVRSSIPKEIAKDAAHQVTSETVLKYLRASREVVDETDME